VHLFSQKDVDGIGDTALQMVFLACALHGDVLGGCYGVSIDMMCFN
jgi:hypothetical protein